MENAIKLYDKMTTTKDLRNIKKGQDVTIMDKICYRWSSDFFYICVAQKDDLLRTSYTVHIYSDELQHLEPTKPRKKTESIFGNTIRDMKELSKRLKKKYRT